MTRCEPARRWLVIGLLLLTSACSSKGGDEVATDPTNTRITLCIGTSAGYADGQQAEVEVQAAGVTLTSASIEVPGQVVLTIPESTPEPRLLVDGREWATSPRGGGWGVGRGDGCPTT